MTRDIVEIIGTASTTTPTAVADGSRVDAYIDEYGRLHNVIDSMPANTTATGTIDLTGESVTITLPAGCGSVAFQVTGVWTGQLDFQGSIDGTNYGSVEASNGSATVNATAGNDIYILPGAGYAKIRIYGTSILTGAAVVTLIASIGTTASILTGSLPAGTNNIGTVSIDTDSLKVPTTFKTVKAAAVGAIATVWTPAAGKKVRLMGGCISLSAAASLLLEDNAAGVDVFQAPVLAANTPYNFDLGNGVLLSHADDVLKATSSAAANLTGTFYGAEE